LNILVTGGAGKIGGFVVAELLSAGHEVTVFDRAIPAERQQAKYTQGDCEDLGQLIGVCSLAEAEAIVHTAGVALPGTTTDDVLFRVNVMSTFNVHEAAMRLGIRRVVSTSSQAALGWPYHTREILPAYLPIDEAHPVQPQHPYSISKVAGEYVAGAYAARSELETIVLRPAWVVFPEVLDALHRDGGVKPRRFDLFGYVDARDVAVAYRLAVETPGIKHEVLLTPAGDSTVTESLATLLPRLEPRIGDMAAELTGTRSAVSGARAERVLGWKPTHSWR
jgi:nucleoside-diphosphate-sugar epimerase